MKLLLKKLKHEVGVVGLFRLITTLPYLLLHNLQLRLFSKGKKDLKNDLNKLKSIRKEQGIAAFRFFPHSSAKVHKGSLDWAAKSSPNKPYFSSVKDVFSLVSFTSSATQEELAIAISLLPNNKEDSFYRTHALNRGRNDQWEYYLVPWHRLIPAFSFLLWDDRFTEHLLPVYKKFKKWYGEFIWFTAIGTGSNIYACEAGKAFHCLNEFVLEGNEKALDRYVKHILKVKYFLRTAFQNGIPMEGGIYARFLLDGIILLDQIHRAFEFKFELIDGKFIQEFSDYLDTAFTRGGGFETSGDSHWELESLQDYSVFLYLNTLTPNSIYEEILSYYKPQAMHYTHLFLDLK